MERRRANLVGPTLLISVGVILLLNNVGYLNWSLWDVLQLWPVLIIAAGLELLLGRGSLLGSLLAALLTFFLVVGGVVLAQESGLLTSPDETVRIGHPANGARALLLDLTPAVANLTIEPLDDSANVVEGSLQLWDMEELDQRFTGGERAHLVLASRTRGGLRRVGAGRGATWALRVSPEVTTELRTDIGVGNLDLRLRQLAVSKADINFGVGRARIVVPAATSGEIDIDGGVGAISLLVPRTVGVQIVNNAALVASSFPATYTRNGQTYRSPNWDRADHRIRVNLGLGVGSITVVPLDD
jgi:hypothetical protein